MSESTVRAERLGNNFDVMRRRNLSLVFGRVHTLGAVSRSELARETGLNRSTIGALVTELVQAGLVVETDPGQNNQVGRPSPVIVPSDRIVAITVHPEVDSVHLALVALGGRVIRRVRYDTTRVPSAQEVVNIAAAVIDGMRGELDSTYRTVGIGVAVPGLVRMPDGVVTLAPRLGWHDEPLSEMLSDATGYAVFAGSDASVGAVAESMRGVGRGVDDIVYLNGAASGIGGGIIAGGVPIGGTSGYAGELGHLPVNTEGSMCHCGGIGCLDTEVTRAPLLELLGLTPAEWDQLEVALLARLGSADEEDPLAAVVERQLGFLAKALATIVNVFNPRLIVLGGFLGSLYMSAPEGLTAAVRSLSMTGPRESFSIARASLGIVTVGAAELAFAGLVNDPTASLQERQSMLSVDL